LSAARLLFERRRIVRLHPKAAAPAMGGLVSGEVVMRRISNPTGSRLVPALRYRDVAGAVDWLCGAFGFERQDIVTAVDGTILHARLTFGSDMILLLPVRTPDGGAGRAHEDAGSEMQSCYFVVDDADLHYQHAKAAGAEILDITEYDYGGRGYSCRDPEGHLWNFGTFDPRQGQQLAVVEQHWPKQPPYWQTMAVDLRLRTMAGIRSLSEKITPPVVVAAVVAAVIAAATVGWLLVALPQTTSSGGDKRLTFRSVPPPQQRTEETAAAPQAAPVRAPVNTLSVRPVVPQPQSDDFERAVRQQTLPAATGPSRVSSAAFAAVGVPDSSEDASKETAERNAEEALRQLRAAQRTAGEAFRQLREASADPNSEPRRQQAARTAPDPRELQVAREQLAREQTAREQQAARERERVAKEHALALQEQMARERAAKEATERISAVSPAKEPPRPAPEQKPAEGFWDCQPSAETGQVVCNPKKAAAAAAAVAPSPPKPKVTAAEPAKAPAPAARQEQKADPRLWDCQPKPPTGEVVCRPVAAKQ
jgi:uncharacterized glyoxalase superfamily protein PhnB